ncbi:HEPN domain-containing protein [Methanospirillum lacunae]|uniref:DNA-binding protein n=1 Tax=Methanospirillum lacunae TaxID=668570 RepID=A0A2V2MRK5_9EURY|nr:HEPN domain-containing protein [Methanospirillum lacunae]PWR70019.1 DNA-binding protein [Methanospirillum lacunae]
MSAEEESAALIRLGHDDLIAAKILFEKDGPSSIICFHAQQTVEKGLKAVLIRKGTPIRKIHDLVELTELIQDLSLTLPVDGDMVALLNLYAVKARYDDTITDTLSPEEAIEIAKKVIEWSELVTFNH